jgi:hypothetical protein
LPVAAALAVVTDAFTAIEEASAADLLQAFDATSPWTLSFPHPLVRAAVYDALGPARRRALHTEAAALMMDEAAALRHRVAAAAEPDEELAADLTGFADAQARRQDWQSAAAHAVAASRLSPDPGSAQRRVLRAVIWAMLRGDAANAGQYAADAAGYAPNALRDVVLGSLAMAADDPTTTEQLLTAVRPESAVRGSGGGWDRGADDRDPLVRPAGRAIHGALVRTCVGGHPTRVVHLPDRADLSGARPGVCRAHR